MNDFAIDPLARRLAALDLRAPDAHELTARVLRGRHEPPRRSPIRLTLALAAVVVIATLAATYYAPAFSQALADVPVAGWFLRDVGLANAAQRITSLDASAAGAGYTVRLVGGYADGARTLLFTRVAPAARIGVDLRAPPELVDQFGRTYALTGAIQDAANGEAVLEFAPLEWPASALGARLALRVRELRDGLPPSERAIAGPWTLTGTIAVDEARDLTPPAPVDLGSLHLVFTRIRVFPAALLVEFRASGASPDELTRRIPDGLKGRAAFRVELRDPSGMLQDPLEAGFSGAGQDVSGQWLWSVHDTGGFRLRIVLEGSGSAEREIPR